MDLFPNGQVPYLLSFPTWMKIVQDAMAGTKLFVGKITAIIDESRTKPSSPKIWFNPKFVLRQASEWYLTGFEGNFFSPLAKFC